MYLRWVTRRHKSPASADTVFHDAYLVESYRDTRGRPRQRTVGYLGNLRSVDGELPQVETELFLLRATQRLHSLAAIGPIDVEAVREDLQRQLPQLTPQDAREVFNAQVRWFCHWWMSHGTSAVEDEIAAIVNEVLDNPNLRER